MRLALIALVILPLAVGCGTMSGLSGNYGANPGNDPVPPSVTGTFPERDGATALEGPISVTFSKPMNARSVTFKLVPSITFGTGQWSNEPNDRQTVTFVPQTPLSAGTRYTATITGKDRAGNNLPAYSWSFTAGASLVATGAGETALKDKVEARADERLFTLFAALNATGYDEGAREPGIVRAAVRQKLDELPLKAVEGVRRFREAHAAALGPYVAYVLSLGPPPQFTAENENKDFGGLNRLLADFYATAKVSDLWKAHKEAHSKATSALRIEGVQGMGRVLDYMRTSALPVGRIVLVPNLLDAAGRGYLVRDRDTATLVVGSNGDVERAGLTTLFARFLLDTARADIAGELQRTSVLYPVVRELAQRHGYEDWAVIVRESLVAALTVHLAVPVEQRDRALKEHYARGLLLVDHFVAELAKYERETVALVDFLPQMLRSVNLDDQRRLFAERKR